MIVLGGLFGDHLDFAFEDLLLDRRHGPGEPNGHLFGVVRLRAQALRLGTGLQESVGAATDATLHKSGATEHIAVQRGHGQSVLGGQRSGRLKRVRDEGVGQRAGDEVGERPAGAHHVAQGAGAGRHGRRHTRGAGSCFVEDQEPAAPGLTFVQFGQCLMHLPGVIHHDVLEQVAEQRVHGALKRTFDGDVVGKRAVLTDDFGRLGQQEPRRIPKRGALPFNVFQRPDARLEAGQLTMGLAQLPRQAVAFRACRRQGGFGREAFGGGFRHGRAGLLESDGRALPITRCAIRFLLQVAQLDLEAAAFLRHAVARSGRVVARLAQRRECRRRRHHGRAGLVGILFDALHGGERALVFLFTRGDPALGLGQCRGRARDRLALHRDGFTRRRQSCVEVTRFSAELFETLSELLDLLTVETDLLLVAADAQLTLVRLFTRVGGRTFGFRQLNAQCLKRGLQLGDMRGRSRLTHTRLFETCVRRRDVTRQRFVFARELHLFPSPEFFPETFVASGFCGLAFERATLLLDLKDDVVHTREVLLGGLELQLGRPASCLVFGDTSGFFDEGSALGWTRRQNLTDLALLNDGIRLHTEAGVHQQVMHIPQPAHFTVDQVFTFTGPIQTTTDLDVTRHQRQLAVFAWRRTCGWIRILFENLKPRLHRHGHAHLRDIGQPQAHLGRRRGFAGVAAVEDDVFHPLAAQALCALLTQHPGDGVHHVALAAAVGSDDGRHAVVKRQLGAIRKTLESVDVQSRKSHVISQACGSA